MPLDGDFSGLRKLIGAVDRTKRGDTQQAIAQALAGEAQRLARKQFSEGEGPVGGPWAPRKDKPGTPLEGTGGLAGSFTGKVKGSGTSAVVVVSTSKKHAYPLHFGWGTGSHLARLREARDKALEGFETSGTSKSARMRFRRRSLRLARFDRLRGKAPGRPMLPAETAGRWLPDLEKSAKGALFAAFKI